jgi:hypothetical protein|tara:strand:+ start:412 stop:681 length:270 start_codon:yes stop_codon:yes gene_type:complete
MGKSIKLPISVFALIIIQAIGVMLYVSRLDAMVMHMYEEVEIMSNYILDIQVGENEYREYDDGKLFSEIDNLKVRVEDIELSYPVYVEE